MLNSVSFGSASTHATSRPRAEAAPNTITLLRKQPASAATAASARCAENDPCEARRIRALGIVLQINRVTVPHADGSSHGPSPTRPDECARTNTESTGVPDQHRILGRILWKAAVATGLPSQPITPRPRRPCRGESQEGTREIRWRGYLRT
jgi:hypothetical protein